MRVRNAGPYSYQSSVSQTSLATAQDDFWSAEEGDFDDDVTVEAHHHHQQHVAQAAAVSSSSSSHAAPDRRLGDDFDATHDRDASRGSWHGGMAI